MNKFIELVNCCFKIMLIICIVIYLAIYYQSILNQRFQYHTMGYLEHRIVISDTKKGDLYFSDDYPNYYEWAKREPVKKAIPE